MTNRKIFSVERYDTAPQRSSAECHAQMSRLAGRFSGTGIDLSSGQNGGIRLRERFSNVHHADDWMFRCCPSCKTDGNQRIASINFRFSDSFQSGYVRVLNTFVLFLDRQSRILSNFHFVRSISIRWFNERLSLSRVATDSGFCQLTFEGQLDCCDQRKRFGDDDSIDSFSLAAMLLYSCSEWFFKTVSEGHDQFPKQAPVWNRQYNWAKTGCQLVLLFVILVRCRSNPDRWRTRKQS